MFNQIKTSAKNKEVAKYVDVEPENIEIKVILKEYKKRELQCLNSTN